MTISDIFVCAKGRKVIYVIFLSERRAVSYDFDNEVSELMQLKLFAMFHE